MTFTFKKQNPKLIIGIFTRTTNEGLKCQDDIPPLWEKFFGEHLVSKIPNRLNQNLYAVYTAYEGDYTKPYTYLLGCEVSSLDKIPEGMMGIEIPSSQYASFPVQGDFPLSLLEAWQEIWDENLKRSYTFDFEVYPPDFDPRSHSDLEIYIAVPGDSA